ncbi:MAG TPA: cytochrome c maturation protein CcmE [Ktedonobacteraceae bacterium]|nr:cytochrome c maturation protein CcmE [Ktedonobacteraceae bacterium]
MQPTVTAPGEEKISRRSRKRLPLSFIIGGVAILVAVLYLVYANTQASAVYYMTVTELQHCTTCTTQSVRVAGIVRPGSIARDDQKNVLNFVITEGNQALPVTYTGGVVPDIFRAGIQVVVEGYYTGSGPFKATTLLARCPSKFTAATPAP